MNHGHDEENPCPYCKPARSDRPLVNKSLREKLLSFLGVCGCASCYFAMFPAILLGIVGVLGLSTSSTTGALNAYMNSILFQPILAVSILFLILGLLHYGSAPVALSIISGIGIFASMNFYMRSYLFTLSFAVLAIAYLLAYQKYKSPQIKMTLFLISIVVILGVIDVVRDLFTFPGLPDSNIPQQQMPSPQQMPPSMMQMQ